MRSSVFTALDLPRDDEGNVLSGYVQATKPHLPLPADDDYPERIVVHAEPGAAIPEDALQVIVDGSVVDWIPEQIAAGWPTGSKYVLEAEWMDGEQLVRGKVVEIPQGVTPIATNIVGHSWAGDS